MENSINNIQENCKIAPSGKDKHSSYGPIEEHPWTHQIKNGFLADVHDHYLNVGDTGWGDILREFEYYYERYGTGLMVTEVEYHYGWKERSCVDIYPYGFYNNLSYLFQFIRGWISSTFKESEFYVPAHYESDLEKCTTDNWKDLKKYFSIYPLENTGFNIKFHSIDKEDFPLKTIYELRVENVDINQANPDKKGFEPLTIECNEEIKNYYN